MDNFDKKLEELLKRWGKLERERRKYFMNRTKWIEHYVLPILLDVCNRCDASLKINRKKENTVIVIAGKELSALYETEDISDLIKFADSCAIGSCNDNAVLRLRYKTMEWI